MNSEISLVEEVKFTVVSRRIKVLGVAIMIGVFVIYLAGLFVTSSYVNKDLAVLNLISLIACTFLCIISVYIKKAMLKKINSQNFVNNYFTAHIIPFAIADAGGLFSITTNLFINSNIPYATVSIIVTLVYIFINFPRHDDLSKMKLEKGV